MPIFNYKFFVIDRVNLNDQKINSYWKYEFDNENCPLCHKNLMDATQEEIQKKNITGKIVVGKCNHAIHENCMNIDYLQFLQ